MKILIIVASLLLFTLSTFAQTRIDESGYPLSTTKKAYSHPYAATIDTSFSFADTLHFPVGYSPRPGQFSKDSLEYYLSLVFGSYRQLYVLKRTAVGEPFGEPQLLAGTMNDTSFQNNQPSITLDKKTIVFVRSAGGTWIESDLYIATRTDTSLPFDSLRALTEINSLDTADTYPWISPDGLHLYFTKGDGIEDDLFMSTRNNLNEPFSTPVLLEVDLITSRKISCWLSNDELELYFTAGESGDSVMHSIRQNPLDPFPAPVLIPSLSKYGFVAGISLAGDELYLYNVNIFGTVRNILTFRRNITSVDDNIPDKPVDFILNQNYPNPFNPITNFQFTIDNYQLTILKVFDLFGREVTSLVNEVKYPGKYTVSWDASNFPSGVYYYRLQTGKQVESKKLMLLK
ncbi:MAG: T9SS type A sorting domain-containing protein [Ignavibacteriales bacterium]|nr:T9SS type A sorting domain-containing protein [Ignavibacteriales bacterium]